MIDLRNCDKYLMFQDEEESNMAPVAGEGGLEFNTQQNIPQGGFSF